MQTIQAGAGGRDSGVGQVAKGWEQEQAVPVRSYGCCGGGAGVGDSARRAGALSDSASHAYPRAPAMRCA